MPKVIKRGEAPGPPSPPSSTTARPVKKRIIEREVVGATQEAEQIRRQADAEAQRILREAEHQARQAVERGYEEGRQQGLAEHTRQIAAALNRVHEMEAELEPLYVGLVRECVEKLIGQELTQNPAAVLGVVRAALADARQQREIIVRVHPEDVAALEKHKTRLMELLARAQNLEIRPDQSVSRGGCIVMTELGAIDASLERQLDALATALDAELRESAFGFDAEESELDPEDDPGAGY